MIYNVRIPKFTLAAATTAIATIISSANRSFIITELDFTGLDSSSAPNEMGLYAVGTAGSTGGAPLTFQPQGTFGGTAPSFQGTSFTTWSTQPLKGALLKYMPINANGGRYWWRCRDNLSDAIEIPGGNNAAGSCAFYNITGSSDIGGSFVAREF